MVFHVFSSSFPWKTNPSEPSLRGFRFGPHRPRAGRRQRMMRPGCGVAAVIFQWGDRKVTGKIEGFSEDQDRNIIGIFIGKRIGKMMLVGKTIGNED